MKISILLPVYNAESTIRETIDSILNQTYTDFEIIIINDGSSDNSEQTILEYKDKRIHYYRNESNRGLIYTLNRGIELCKGEYIARIDADDIMLPTRLEEQIKFMEEHPTIIASGSAVIKFFPNGKQKIYTPPLKPETIKYKILLGSPIPHPSAIIRRDILLKYNIKYDTNYIHAEDYKFWYDLSKHGLLFNIKEPLIKYRCSKEQISQKYHNKQHNTSCNVRRLIVKEKMKEQGIVNIPVNFQFNIYTITAIANKISNNYTNSSILFILLMSQNKYDFQSFTKLIMSGILTRKGFNYKYLIAILCKYINSKSFSKFDISFK